MGIGLNLRLNLRWSESEVFAFRVPASLHGSTASRWPRMIGLPPKTAGLVVIRASSASSSGFAVALGFMAQAILLQAGSRISLSDIPSDIAPPESENRRERTKVDEGIYNRQITD